MGSIQAVHSVGSRYYACESADWDVFDSEGDASGDKAVLKGSSGGGGDRIVWWQR